MAAGDVVSGIHANVANNGVVDIRPGANAEWTIQNMYWSGGGIEVYKTNGTNAVLFYSDSSRGGLFNTIMNASNVEWIQIKNVSGGALNIGYDGRVLK